MLADLPTLRTVYSGRFSPIDVASDYGTLSSGSCDEDGSCHSSSTSSDEAELSIGMCPKCRNMFEFPVSLQCGHSLCRACAEQLLDKTMNSGRSSRSSAHRPKVRMGLSSYSNLDVRTSAAIRYEQLYSKDIITPTYLSPACPVCHEPPKTVPPVTNYALQQLIELLKMRTIDFSNLKITPRPPSSIKEVNIGIIGASKVGKTQLRHCQLLNGVFFPSYEGSNVQFMVNLIENANPENVDGLLVMYSVTRERSLKEVVQAFKNNFVSSSMQNIPCILIGNKADKIHKREVNSHAAQKVARQIGCPFREVSARCNDGISECFVELLRIIDARA